MKFKIALLTLAIIVSTSPAFATTGPVELELGGFFKGYMAYSDQDNAPTSAGVHNLDILRHTEVHFNGETKLDNGTKVGVHIEASADEGDSFAIDESLLYAEGDWGKINFGAKDGAAYLLQVAAPSADKDIDGVRQQIQPVNLTAFGTAIGETDYDQNISGKVDKITYFTPLFEGLQAGVSYTPDSDASRGGNGNALDGDDTAATSNIWDFAARYEHKFGDVKVITGAGYTHAEAETGPANDREAWNAALNLGFGNFNIGAAYQNDDEGSATDDVDYTAIGVSYKMDKFLLGASYYNKNDNVGTQVDTDRYAAGVTYSYAPGIALRSSISHLSSDISGSGDFDATSVVVGTSIDF